MVEEIILTWSGGKDSALTLHELLEKKEYEIAALLTTVTEGYDRISMHGVQRVLLEEQAESLGLPLETIQISQNSSNEEYEARMKEKLVHYKSRGVESVAFGDIFLEDLRSYREENLSKVEMKGVFPLWERDTAEIARTFIELGFRAIVTCVDSTVLNKNFAGRIIDEHFLSDLPMGVDPCGENGEFHSFVYDGPIFRERIGYRKGEVILRDNRFYYCDLMLDKGK